MASKNVDSLSTENIMKGSYSWSNNFQFARKSMNTNLFKVDQKSVFLITKQILTFSIKLVI